MVFCFSFLEGLSVGLVHSFTVRSDVRNSNSRLPQATHPSSGSFSHHQQGAHSLSRISHYLNPIQSSYIL